MSKLWILVHDHQNNDAVVAEQPTTPADLAADLEKVRAKYPAPRYGTSTAGSSKPTATGAELLSGWEHEGFDAKDKAKEPAATR